MEEIDGYALVQKEEEIKPAIKNERDTFFNEDLVSFPECPNHCVGGYMFDPYTHRKKICGYCAEKRSHVVRRDIVDKNSGKTVAELLKLPLSFAGKEYQADTVIPTFARKYIDDDSLERVLVELRNLINKVSVGALPEHSIMFNLGKYACENNFIYPFLLRVYKAGLSVAPMLTSIELMQMRSLYESGLDSDFGDYLDKQVCVVVIDAGANYKEVMAVKGLMQLRANRELPTIIFTGYWQRFVWDLIADDEYTGYNLAKLISVNYIDKDDKLNNNEEEKMDSQNIVRSNPRAKGTTEISTSDLNSLLSGNKQLL